MVTRFGTGFLAAALFGGLFWVSGFVVGCLGRRTGCNETFTTSLSALTSTGTTIGIERIIDVMEELEMFPPTVGQTVTDVLVTRFSAETTLESLRLAQELRQAGLNAELFFPDDTLGNQIRFALKRGIPYVVILGPDEIQAGTVAVRNIALKEQDTVARGEVAARIKSWQQ